jgi:hypothetical protein
VLELELRGNRLAESIAYVGADRADDLRFTRARTEVRLVDVRARRSRFLAEAGIGLGGQMFLGLSFAEGRLAWHRTCTGEPCDGVAYRYDLRGGAQQRARTVGRTEAVTGFALLADDRALIANRQRVELTDPLPFR